MLSKNYVAVCLSILKFLSEKNIEGLNRITEEDYGSFYLNKYDFTICLIFLKEEYFVEERGNGQKHYVISTLGSNFLHLYINFLKISKFVDSKTDTSV